MAKSLLKKLTSKKKSTPKSEKKDSSSPAPTNPVPLPVIARNRTTSGAPQRPRSSITIGANRTPQPPPLTTLQKWSPGTKSGSPALGPSLIGRGRGTSAPETRAEDEKAPYTTSYSYSSPGANLFEEDKDPGPYNNEVGNAPYKVTEFDPEDDKDSGPYNNVAYSSTEQLRQMVEDEKDGGPYNNVKYGTQEDLDAMLEADDDSDYDSEDDELLYQNVEVAPEQKQDEVAPPPTRTTASKETPAVRAHRAWLVAQLSKDYEHERSVQRADLAKAAGGLAREIKVWWELIDELELVDQSDPEELADALDYAPNNHPIRDLTTVAEALEMARKMHAIKLETARRQELPVTEEGELGDISGRLVQYDDQAAQERSLVLVGGSKLFRNDDKSTPVDTKQSSTFHSGLGAEIFVVGMGNDIHMSSHKIGKFHHSSLLGGATVSMAGEMQVTDGRIDWVSNKSGHYSPTVVQLQQFLHHLGKDVPLTFPVLGWGVPKGVTAQQLVDGVDENGQLQQKKSHNYQKTQAMLTAWKDLVGKEAMKRVLKAKGWTLDKWNDEWEVEDANYQAVPPESVRQAMKEAFPDKKPVGEK
jgi:hypothetical protein